LRSLLFSLCLLVVASLLPAGARAAASSATQPVAKPFDLVDGDRVVFLGGTFIEREAKWGYIETALTSRFPDRNITFRNLGYAGDTVRCEARTVCEGWANFGPPEEGFDRLKKLITEIKPTAVFIAYGMGESFEGEKALPQFVSDYNKLLDMLAEASGAQPRFVLIGPNYHEDLGMPLPDPAEHNKLLKSYCRAIEDLADRRGARYVDLYASLKSDSKDHLTDDGIQLTPGGYARAATAILAGMGQAARPALTGAQAERLRQLIVEKNAVYFNYWRHENDTYILGYRKHEQGKNAVEFPEFVKLAEEKDKEIAVLRAMQPVN
jgi:lysophospholipase L1-like esterase